MQKQKTPVELVSFVGDPSEIWLQPMDGGIEGVGTV